MRKWFYLTAVIALIPLSVSVRAQEQTRKNIKVETAKVLAARDVVSQTPKSITEDPNYSIGFEDVLNIDVWKEPEISRTVPVRRDGKISLPLLNDVQAAGLTPTQLSSEIAG